MDVAEHRIKVRAQRTAYLGTKADVAMMETCRSVWARHEQIAARIARAMDLLRTRVNLAQEKDVTRLLAGMERKARNQLHLQHAVEGLSVAAISYYVPDNRGSMQTVARAEPSCRA